jgi:hypothetical protein
MTLFSACSFGGCLGQGEADITPEQRMGVLPQDSACHDIRARTTRHAEVAQAKLQLATDQQEYWAEPEIKHIPTARPADRSYSTREIAAASERILEMCMTKEFSPDTRAHTLFNLASFNKGARILNVPLLKEGHSVEEREAAVKECAIHYLRKSKLRTEYEV